jgi:hypothetical protein
MRCATLAGSSGKALHIMSRETAVLELRLRSRPAPENKKKLFQTASELAVVSAASVAMD